MASGTATTIHFFYPVVVASVMMLFFHEKFSWGKAIAIISGVLGVFFLSGGFSGQHVSLIGFLLVLVTIITYPTYIVGVNNSPVIMKMNGMKMTFYVLFFSAFLFFCNVLIKDGAHFTPLATGGQWANALALSIIPTLVSDFALIYAVQMVGSTVTAILGCMEPSGCSHKRPDIFLRKVLILRGSGNGAWSLRLCSLLFLIKSQKKQTLNSCITFMQQLPYTFASR
jgi:drug/metabolite transporter (DMT)-like permease